MTAKPPPIPPAQRARATSSFAAQDDGHEVDLAQPGNAGLHMGQQGRHGNLHQNVKTVQHKVQDR